MTKLLLRLFVKNSQNLEDPAVRGAVGRLAGITGILCNCLLFAAKMLVGWMAGSVAMMADGLNNLSDTASSIATLLGFRLAQRPADSDHPYGHARYEYLSGLAVAALILLIGADLVRSSVGKILHPQSVAFSAVSIAVLLASIGVKLWMAGFFRTLGGMIRSDTLRSVAADSRNDVLATAAVLLSCLAGRFFGVNIDGWMGLAVAAFILYSGIGIAKEAVSPLLGMGANADQVRKISDLVLSHEKILGIHDLLVHDYGPGQCFASVHAELSAEEDPLVCHDIIDDIECDALRELNVHLVIHYDPVVQNDGEWNEMRQTVQKIVSDMDPRLSVHDFRLVRGASRTKLVFDLEVPYSMNRDYQQLQSAIDQALAAGGKDYLTVIHFDGTI